VLPRQAQVGEFANLIVQPRGVCIVLRSFKTIRAEA